MTTSVIIPKSGMGISEGTLERWLKQEGDTVTKGEIIAEVETAKAMVEIEAPISGVLVKIVLDEGEEAEVLSEIAVIEEQDA